MEGLSNRLRRCVWPDTESADESLQSMLQREASRYSSVSARVLIFGKNSVAAQVVTPLIVQADVLLDSGLIEKATEMADQARNTMSPDTSGYAQRLRSELDYIYQKGGLLLLKETLFDDAFVLLSKGEIDPRIAIQMFGDLKQPKWLHEHPQVIIFDEIQKIVKQLGYIEDIVACSTEKTYGSPAEEDAQKPSPTMELRRALLSNARGSLQVYLLGEREKRRDRLGKGDIVCKAIDTTLLKLCITHKKEQWIYQFLKQPNDCCPEDCANALFKSKRYYALSILLESKKMYEKVLETWTRIYTGELPDPEFKDGLNRIKQLLLQKISDDELSIAAVMYYAWWLTDQSPTDGVDIFICSPRAADMDPDEILEKLQQYGNEPVRTYLEHLVLKRKSENTEYHTRLACSYVHDVQRELENGQLEQMEELVKSYKQVTKTAEITEGDQIKYTFVGFLGSQTQTSLLYSADVVFKALPKTGFLNIESTILYGRMGMHEEALHILIHDLGDFMGAETYCVTNGQSTGTIPEIEAHQTIPPARLSALNQAPKTENNLDSMEKLETEQVNERRQLFSMLLRTYLAIKERELMLERTMHLLNTQGIYLDAVEVAMKIHFQCELTSFIKVLNMIPEDWPIEMLQHFLMGALRRSLHDYQESQVVLGMSRGENVMVGSELIEVYQD
ncbi:hypothetical protein DFQ30_001230, partial [Apophysomyces sp. BC1015]